MTIPLVTRAPTANEIARLKLILSVFGDGTGQESDAHGTRPGWRDLERAVAVWLSGHNPANKDVFDVVVKATTDPLRSYGLSIKSKDLSRASALADLAVNGRVYMELANSPAKFWGPLSRSGIVEADFRQGRHAQAIGDSITSTVQSWHLAQKIAFEAANPERTLDLDRSIYLTVSYKTDRRNGVRDYQLHSFGLEFPSNIIWTYRSERCLMGVDRDFPGETIFDWYGLSGGQLKYYPRAASARFASTLFQLAPAPQMSLAEKAARYWPDAWIASGGDSAIAKETILRELTSLAFLSSNPATRNALQIAIDAISAL